MDKIHQPPQYQDTLINKEMRGLELEEEIKIWREVSSSEARLTLLRNMLKEQLAFADLEEFGIEFHNKLRTLTFKNKTLYTKISKPAMVAKLADEQILRRDLMRLKMKMKKDLAERMKGENSRKYKRVVNHLNKIGRDNKAVLNEKYKNKIKHLKDKYRTKDEEEEKRVPEDLKEYSDLSVYNKEKFDEIEVEEGEVKVIGDVVLTEEEKTVLKLHTKFSVMENLKRGGLDIEQEASIAKLRMEIEKEKEYDGYTTEEKRESEKLDSEGRMIFDPKSRTFDYRKRRVTDLKECARVTLPKPLTPEEESKIEVRKRTQKEIYEKYRTKNTNHKGEQKSNLTKKEKEGLDSLQKRIKEDEIIIMKTDKSGKFVVTTPEAYVNMGKEHTDKDEEISWETVQKLEKTVNAHTIAWNLIFQAGQDHNHQDRIVRSRNTRSSNQANLSLLYKDHKIGNKTRPVASGNESYNLGLSNSVSELLESVARSIKSPYSVISSEDLLARTHRYNEQVPTVITKPSSTVQVEENNKNFSTVPIGGEIPTPPLVGRSRSLSSEGIPPPTHPRTAKTLVQFLLVEKNLRLHW